LKKNLKLERLRALQIKISSIDGSKKVVKTNIKRIKKDLVLIKKDKVLIEKSVKLLEYIIENNHSSIITMFERAIAGALKDLFNDSYDFKFEFGKRGSITTCEYMVKTDECDTWLHLKMCHGNSVKEIIGTVISIIYIKIKNEMPKIIVLDEPLPGLSLDKQILAGKFLSKITEKFNIQLLMVSHSERLTSYADKRIEI